MWRQSLMFKNVLTRKILPKGIYFFMIFRINYMLRIYGRLLILLVNVNMQVIFVVFNKERYWIKSIFMFYIFDTNFFNR